MLNLDDIRNHSEIGTGYTKDAMLNLCADEIEALKAQLSESAALIAKKDEQIATLSTPDFYYDEDEHGGNTLYDLTQCLLMSELDDGHEVTVYASKELSRQQMRLTELDNGGWELQTLALKPKDSDND